jgi:ABC-type dipeptide/oligopeptide/nickel transport system permease component
MTPRVVLISLVRLAATLLVAGLLGVTLVLLAPGYGTSESELNVHLSQESVQSLRAARDTNILRIYGRFLGGALHGDLGVSETLGGEPVFGLLRERLPVTLQAAGAGLLAAWTAALVLAGFGAGLRRRIFDWLGTVATEGLLAVPVGLLALLLLLGAGRFAAAAPAAGIALAVFPHLFRYGKQLMEEAAGRPHVLSAYARGSAPWRVLVREILPTAMPQLVALAGTSLPLAIGAAIPMETICDSPGLGQLAWKAATARDLELLLPIILLVSAIALTANFAADLAIQGRKVAA